MHSTYELEYISILVYSGKISQLQTFVEVQAIVILHPLQVGHLTTPLYTPSQKEQGQEKGHKTANPFAVAMFRSTP